MRAFLVISLCFALTHAQSGYNYPAPSSSYGTPSGIGVANNFGGGAGSIVGGSSIASSFGSSSTSVLGGSNAGFAGGLSSGAGIGAASSFSGGSSFSAGGGAAAAGFGGQSSGVQIQKHIYVHVAPPEPEEARVQQQLPAAQSTKHYKIIFIKAPSYQSYQQQILQQQAQNEEKTIVYVLVKKPEEPGDINIPAPAQIQPSKPEVYFIKYKSRTEATGGVSGIAAGGSQATGTAGFVGGSSVETSGGFVGGSSVGTSGGFVGGSSVGTSGGFVGGNVGGFSGAAVSGSSAGYVGGTVNTATRPVYGTPAQSGPY